MATAADAMPVVKVYPVCTGRIRKSDGRLPTKAEEATEGVTRECGTPYVYRSGIDLSTGKLVWRWYPGCREHNKARQTNRLVEMES